MHHGVLHEQVPPGLHGPLPAGGQGHLQTHLLAAHRGLHLLLHLLEFLVGRGRFRLIVPLARGREVLQLLTALVEDLYLQGGGDGDSELPLPVVEHPLHIFVKAQIRHDPVRQLLRGDAQLRRRELQGLPRRCLHLLEFKFTRYSVNNQKRLGLGA